MSSNDSSNKSKRPANTLFKQQQLKAWQPILTPACVIPTLIVIGVIFIPTGLLLYRSSTKVLEVRGEYPESCKNKSKCEIKFENLNMNQPLYMYYELTNFYQNHRKYVKSRSDAQLRGEVVKNRNDLASCEPYISLNNSEQNDPNLFYLPCGLIAKSIFNDVIILKTQSGKLVNVQKKGIAWESDRDEKFNNPPANAPGIRTVPDFKDEDFVVWMRTAGLPTFRKLYRIIKENLNGTYVVDITNNFDVSGFGGKKTIIISQANFLGGQNHFLGVVYILTGGLCFLLGIIFLVIHCTCERKTDLSYINNFGE